ncbi:alpha-ketoglutarate-dependent dioxygenase AlkB [Aurantivibrio plasticivorans]
MQNELFNNVGPEVIRLNGGELWYFPNWLSDAKASLYFDQLKRLTQWQQSEIRVAGKRVLIPRLNAWYGEPEARYKYSGIQFKPLPYTRALRALSVKLFETLADNVGGDNFEPNSALLNLYRDGNDSVAWHADDEPELGSAPTIASVSLGAERQFLLKPKNNRSLASQTHTQPIKITLVNGSLLLMRGPLQRHWLHCVPKEMGLTQSRLNITFRQVLY